MNTFSEAYWRQVCIQGKMVDSGMYEGVHSDLVIPQDVPHLCSYHIQQLVSEIGEVLEADKRWKNFRNEKFDRNAKLEEIADCFIVLMNISMFSGYRPGEILDAIARKQDDVLERIEKEI